VRPTHRLLSRLHRVALRPECGVTDAQLLEHFLAGRDEGAFEELVRRHGPMVLGVCRRVLGEAHDAADAFQATFLVLVRRAAAILPRSRVGPWLYGVARRTALKVRSSAARRRRAEQEAGLRRPTTMTAADAAEDLRPLLDEELGRLPEKYCAPLVLCLLEGKSRKEAAGLLGWSEGTLSGRLARAKEMLGHRLRRRGVVSASAALASVLAESAAAAPVPPALAVATLKAAVLLAGPAAAGAVSAPVIALTEEVLRAMLTSKLKAVAGLVVLVAGIGIGAGAAARQYGPPSRQAPAEGYSDAKPAAVPEKGKKPRAKSPAYIIEPPDVLRVEYARADSADPVKITGQRLVRPDGTVSLGQLGSVSVAGLSAEQARGAIAKHLAARLDGFDREKLTVEVAASNSKFLYVIVDDADGGEEVYRLPATGNETVLDVIAQVKGALVGIGRKRTYVRRLSEDGKMMSVYMKGIIQDGDTDTNYPLRPGDRVFVKGVRPPQKAEGAGRIDGIFLNSRNFKLPFSLDDAHLFDRVVLFVSEDEGRTYQQAATAPADCMALPVSVEHDGTYWFVVQVRQKDGRLEPADVTAAKPMLKVCVDTKPPEGTIYQNERRGDTVELAWEVRDANLDVETLKLEFRPTEQDAWSALNISQTAKGHTSFTLPREAAAGPVEVRLTVRDRAGNVGKAIGKLR
jgi:RNA polymerase sigma factor (sigma-70 family)